MISAVLLSGQAQLGQLLGNVALLVVGVYVLIGVFTWRRVPLKVVASTLLVSGLAVQGLVLLRLRLLDHLRQTYPLVGTHSWREEMFEGGAVGVMLYSELLALPSGVVAWICGWALLLLIWQQRRHRTKATRLSAR